MCMQVVRFSAATFVVVLCCICSGANVSAQTGCRCTPLDDTVRLIFNVDTIAVDTCGLGEAYTDCYAAYRAVYQVWGEDTLVSRRWVRGRWEIKFLVDAIQLPPAPADSMIYLTWRAVDSSYGWLRTALHNLEKKYGRYTLRKQSPEDTTLPYGQWYFLRFDNWVNLQSAQYDLHAIDSCSATFEGGIIQSDGVHQGQLGPPDGAMTVYPQPASQLIYVQTAAVSSRFSLSVAAFDLLGRRYDLRAANSGFGTLAINIEQLPEGVYSLHAGGHWMRFLVRR